MSEVNYAWTITMTDRDSNEITVSGAIKAETFQSALDQARGSAFAYATDGSAGVHCKGPYRIIHMALTRDE